jgi:hypothetical protein
VGRIALKLTDLPVTWDRGIPVHVDFIGWDRGRASASLIALRGGAPLPRAFELGLARRMDARMRP